MVTATTLNYEVVEDEVAPGDWRVEAVGQDGEVFVAIFSGADNEARAREYAAFKAEQQR